MTQTKIDAYLTEVKELKAKREELIQSIAKERYELTRRINKLESIVNRASKIEKGSVIVYKRKTVDRWDLMSNYGYGWECEVSYDTYAEAKADLKAYCENGGGQYRLEKHRERIK